MTDILGDAPANLDTFDALVGEGKKYSDPNALAKAKTHADAHISTLESELNELRAELRARTSVEEIISKMKPNSETPPNEGREPNSIPNVEGLVQKELDRIRAKESADSNLEKTRKGLKERFGDDYNKNLEAAASTLQVTPAFLKQLATTSPEAVFRLLDSVKTAPAPVRPVAPPQGGVNAAVTVGADSIKNNAYYSKLRREDPNTYFSRRVQKEMHDQAMRQGEAFYQ